MTTLEIIKELCDKEGISITGLEKELGYSNGSLTKSKSISSERVYEISRRFHVPMEYLMTGEVERVNEETQRLERKRKVLEEINMLNQKILELYKQLNVAQNRLDDLNRKYEAILTEESIPSLAELTQDKTDMNKYFGRIGNE